MAVKESVFGSPAERELYESIVSQWCPPYKVWHGIHFGNIFALPSLGLSPREWNTLAKSEVDFTLCTDAGRPLLSIEFDGMGGGFSRMGEYVQARPVRELRRKEKLDLKLRIARENSYPFFVISGREIRRERRDTRLTVVDGIIGETLEKRELSTTIPRAVAEEAEYASSLPDGLREEYLDDVVVEQEVMARMKFNPIAREVARLENLLYEAGIRFGQGYEPLWDPEWKPRGSMLFCGRLAPVYDPRDRGQLGCAVVIQIHEHAIRETVWVRNFDGSGVWPGMIAHDIASLFALRHAVRYCKLEAC